MSYVPLDIETPGAQAAALSAALMSAIGPALIGTVTQTGGVADGAVFEYGSNANGVYVRLACNLQICMYLDSTGMTTESAAGNVWRSAANFTWTFPAAFSSTSVFAHNSPNALGRWGEHAAPSATAVNFRQIGTATSAVAVPQMCFAVGPWF